MNATRRVRASVVCVDRDELLCVRLRDPVTRVLRVFPPGGAIEPGESPARAAARETLEETGYRVEVDAASEHVIHYPFTWAGFQIACTTHFFAANLTTPRETPAAVHDAAYNEGAFWLPLSQLPAALGFDRNIRNAVQHVLARDA